MSETISCPFTFVKDGVFYFTRRIPKELRDHYTSPRIAYSLRTRSARIAEARARRAADQLDEYWYHLRSQISQLPGKHLLRQMLTTHEERAAPVPSASSSIVLLSEAVGIYLRQKGRGKSKTFHRAAERACGYVIDVCGDRPLDAYTKADANAFRDALIARGLAGSSMTRVFGTVRAVTNFAASEMGVNGGVKPGHCGGAKVGHLSACALERAALIKQARSKAHWPSGQFCEDHVPAVAMRARL